MFVFGLLSFQSGCKTFIVTLLTGSNNVMSVINSGPKSKDYSDYSSYSYSGIGPQNAPLDSRWWSSIAKFIFSFLDPPQKTKKQNKNKQANNNNKQISFKI